jgi:hypothetical protein
MEQTAKFRCIEFLQAARNHHKIVGRLVKDKQLIIAIVYQASCRVFRNIPQNIIFGRKLIFIADYLQYEQADSEQDPHKKENAPDHVFTVLVIG